jgi:hypothetical protein
VSPNRYYVMAAENPDRMLLYSMPDLPDDLSDDWLFGKPFSVEPEEPIRVTIQEGFEKKQLLPFFDHPPLVSAEFLKALQDAGVDNVVAYDAEICSEDERIIHRGYKAINIIGVIEAAAAGTVFTGDSRSFDAAIEGLEIDPEATRDALMFRLAENQSAIVVHERVKRAIEAGNFHSVVFREPETFVSI